MSETDRAEREELINKLLGTHYLKGGAVTLTAAEVDTIIAALAPTAAPEAPQPPEPDTRSRLISFLAAAGASTPDDHPWVQEARTLAEAMKEPPARQPEAPQPVEPRHISDEASPSTVNKIVDAALNESLHGRVVVLDYDEWTRLANPPAARQPGADAELVERLNALFAFLDGSASLRGCWFGERPPDMSPFWWRDVLRDLRSDLLARLSAPAGERDDRAGDRAEVERLRTALKGLLDEHDRNTCLHEETYRGGVIWTICNGCGKSWADDKGGFVPHADPPAVAAARAALEGER